MTRDSDVDFFQTTYKDNPFLNDVVVKEIEQLKDIDENYWRVYGLGKEVKADHLYFNFTTIKDIPESAKLIAKP